MGNQDLETRRHGVEASSYSIISFPAEKLPDTYRNYILTKWLRTLRHSNSFFRLTSADAYFKKYQPYIKSLLAKKDSVIRLAVLSDDYDVVLGFSVIEDSTLHYVFVQQEQRNKGIGTKLVPVPIHTITHLTKIGMNAWHNKLPHAIFDPF